MPSGLPSPSISPTPPTPWQPQRGWATELVGAPGSWVHAVAPEPNSSPQAAGLCQAAPTPARVLLSGVAAPPLPPLLVFSSQWLADWSPSGELGLCLGCELNLNSSCI